MKLDPRICRVRGMALGLQIGTVGREDAASAIDVLQLLFRCVGTV
ncbi:hypothetical protein [Burkholderia guangdongensis]|nr:hypothetical protein [Burkholderia guangdongensis]